MDGFDLYEQESLAGGIAAYEHDLPKRGSAMYDGKPESPLVMSHLDTAKEYISYRTGKGPVEFCCGKQAGRGEPDYMENPLRVKTHSSGLIMVPDQKNNGILLFDARNQGKFLRKIGAEGENMIVTPEGICEDVYGNIIVCEHDKHQVSVYNTQGEKLGVLLTTKNGVWHPMGVDCQKDRGLLVVAHSDDIEMTEVKYYITVYQGPVKQDPPRQ